MKKRILADIALFLSIVLLPWWISAPALIAALFYFESYYESIFGGFFIDSLYMLSNKNFFAAFPFTLGLAILFCASYTLKDRFTLGRTL